MPHTHTISCLFPWGARGINGRIWPRRTSSAPHPLFPFYFSFLLPSPIPSLDDGRRWAVGLSTLLVDVFTSSPIGVRNILSTWNLAHTHIARLLFIISIFILFYFISVS